MVHRFHAEKEKSGSFIRSFLLLHKKTSTETKSVLVFFINSLVR